MKKSFLGIVAFFSLATHASSYEAYYEVPLSPTLQGRLSDDSHRFSSTTFECNNERMEYSTDIELVLPADLVGRDTPFRIQRTPGTNQWKGPDVKEAHCLVEDYQSPFDSKARPYFNCHLNFTQPRVDLAQVEQNIRSKPGFSPAELFNRMAVAQAFQDEHIGIIRYPFKEGGRGRGRGRGGDPLPY